MTQRESTATQMDSRVPPGLPAFVSLPRQDEVKPSEQIGPKPPASALPPAVDLNSTHLSDAIAQLRNCGVSAHRRNSPDLIGQLQSVPHRPADVLICNLLDSDENVPLNCAWAARHTDDLFTGLVALARLTSVKNVLIVMEADLPFPVIRQIPEAARQVGARLIRMRGSYPLSDPTLLLYALLGRRLRPGRLPVEQGVVLLDAAASVAVGRCTADGQSMTEAPLAVRDHYKLESHYCLAPVGTTIGWVLDRLGLPSTGVTLRVGDLLRDQTVTGDDLVTGRELILHVSPPNAPVNPDPCIRCGWCVEACPTRIQPAGLLEAAQYEDPHLADHYGIDACIECGICSYVCPSRLPLLHAIRKMKAGAAD